MIDFAFDIYAAATPNGTRLVRLTPSEAVELTARKVLHGTGEGGIRIHSEHADATAANFTRRNVVKVVPIVDGIDQTAIFAWLLDEGDFDAVSRKERGGRMLSFEGPGLLFWLDRWVLTESWYAPDKLARGSSYIEQPGMWRWTGEPYGAILTRIVEEGQHHPNVGTRPFAPITLTFTRTQDTDGELWPEINGDWETPTGTNVLDIVQEFIRYGLIVQMTPNLALQAYQTFGVDRTSTTFAVGKVRFAHGHNVANEMRKVIQANMERSHVLVLGVTPGISTLIGGGSSDVPYVDKVMTAATDNLEVLQAAGQRNLTEREKQSDAAFPVRHIVGNAAVAGLYIPGIHYNVGDLVTVHSVPDGETANPHDFDDQAIEVAAFTILHDDAGNWFGEAELGAQYVSAQRKGFEERISSVIRQPGSHTHPPNPELCRAGTAATVLYDLNFEGGAHTVAVYPSGTGTWPANAPHVQNDGNPPGADGGAKVGWGNTAAGDEPNSPKLPVTPGLAYHWRVWAYTSNISTGNPLLVVSFYDATTPTAIGLSSHHLATGLAANATWEEFSGTFTAPPGAAFMRLEAVGGWGFGVNSAYDLVSVTLPAASINDGHPLLIGTGPRAKRCSDTEHFFATRPPTVADDFSSAGMRRGTHWVWVDDIDNPTESYGSWVAHSVATGAAVWIQLGGGTTTAPPTQRTFPYFVS
jgi:hypothetical protein